MTGLIKANVAPDVCRFAAPVSAATQAVVAQRSPLQCDLDEARAEIARLQGEIADHRRAAARERTVAYDAGKADGLLSAEDDAKRRLACLDAALDAAREEWNRRLEAMEILAVQLARLALAKLFAESGDLGDLVARAVASKLAEIADTGVVSVAVSGRDFPEQADLDALEARVPNSSGAIRRDAALEAGRCRIDLDLGHVDLGVATLAAEIDAALAELIQGKSGA